MRTLLLSLLLAACVPASVPAPIHMDPARMGVNDPKGNGVPSVVFVNAPGGLVVPVSWVCERGGAEIVRAHADCVATKERGCEEGAGGCLPCQRETDWANLMIACHCQTENAPR